MPKRNPSTSTQRDVSTVIVSSLNLPDQPSTKGKVIRKLPKDEVYKVWGEPNGWLRVGKDM